MTPKLKAALKEISERCEAASAGPWRAGGDEGWPIGSFSTGNSGIDGKDYTVWTEPMSGSELGEADARNDALFIAAARSDVPKLVAALDACLVALEVCARPGTYHLVGSIEEQGNYKARNAITKAEKIILGEK